MKNIRFTFPIIFFLFLAHNLAFGAFSTHTGTCIMRTFDSVSKIVNDSIIVTVKFNNSEGDSIRGFYYAEHIPLGLTVNTVSVKINEQEISDYLFESGTADEVYSGSIVYRWISETPTTLAEDNPVYPGSSVEIVYSLSSNQPGTFYCDNFNWIGYYKDAPVEKRAAFGYSEDDDKQTISFVNSFEMKILEGWSMISLPIKPSKMKLSDLFPEAVVVYGYKKGLGYFRVKDKEVLEVGKGYWIFLKNEKNYIIPGEYIYKNRLFITENGWEMIGGCTFPAKLYVDGCIIGAIYDFIPEVGYKTILTSEYIEPRKGYWITFDDIGEQCEFKIETTDSSSRLKALE